MNLFRNATIVATLSLLLAVVARAGEPVGGINVSLEQIPGGHVNVGGTSQIPGLPAGFFGPGSLPFEGTIPLRGLTAAETDPLLPRDGRVLFPGASKGEFGNTIPIEIVALSLHSIDPIQVQNSDGTVEDWDVRVSITTPTPGQLALSTPPSGNFVVDSFFDIEYRIEFSSPGSPGGGGVNPLLVDNLGSSGMDGVNTSVPAPFPTVPLPYDACFPNGACPGFVIGSDGSSVTPFRMDFGDGSLQVIATATPEPTSLALIGIGALAMTRRRRSK